MSRIAKTMYRHERVNENNKADVISFLENYTETSLFLLGNLEHYGFTLTNHMNSGNYACIKKDNTIAAVFCLTRRGNLLLQTDGNDNYSALIYDTCKNEPVLTEGIVGEWTIAKSYWDYLCSANNRFKEITIVKENLYSLNISRKDENKGIIENHNIRFLNENDFSAYDDLIVNFTLEMGLTVQGSKEERHIVFSESIQAKFIWGLYLNDTLVSTCQLNTKHNNIGQVGGVYTIPHKRCKGYSYQCIAQLIHDCKNLHNLETLILFTDQKNTAANRLYQNFGFKIIGDFGLLFGKYIEL